MQNMPVGMAAMVVNGAYRQNALRSELAGDHTWWIYPTTITLDYGRWPVPVTFGNMWNLIGGTGADQFEFLPQYGLDGNMGGFIDGGGGGDWLDYSNNMNPVTVDLTPGTAPPLPGTSQSTRGLASGVGGGVSHIQNVMGSRTATNTLTGDMTFNAVGNILIGGAAADVLTAGSGNSILIGDGGADRLDASRGTPGFDILIGGITDFDSSTATNLSVLNAFFNAWQNTNAANYNYQVALLRDTGVSVGGATYRLNNSSVHDDSGAADTLIGATSSQAALDWFFSSMNDSLQNLKDHEIVTAI